MEMKLQSTKNTSKLQGVAGLLGLTSALIAIFALVVTIVAAWKEHAEQSWPSATATVQHCSVDPYYPLKSSGRRIVWNIECHISYVAGSDEIASKIRSRSAASDSDIQNMRHWVALHRPGSLITIHYDPVEHKTTALIATDMPFAGPRTPNNLKFLIIASIACAVLLSMARVHLLQSDKSD